MKLRNKKTGKVFDAIVREYSDDGEEYSIIVCDLQKYRKVGESTLILGKYDSLAKLYEEWEDYKPAEPLIKDPKIRRELSDWIALYGEHEKIKYYRYNDFVIFSLCRERGTPQPEISLPIIYDCDSLREGKEYTKPELCGGEEC